MAWLTESLCSGGIWAWTSSFPTCCGWPCCYSWWTSECAFSIGNCTHGSTRHEMALIDIQEVTRSYGSPPRPVLSRISLSIEEGEFVCLLGQTGCGKSTLLRLVLGSEKPCEGRILIDGA